ARGSAVADENGSVRVPADSVRPRQSALQRIAVRAVAAFASARYQFNGSLANVDHADAVTFGIGEIDLPIRRDADSLRSGQSRLLCRTAVAREPFLTGAGNVMDRACLQVEPVNRVPFTQRQPHISGLVKLDCPGAVQRCIR